MIDFIDGKVASKAPGELVLSAGGVGFLLMCSNATLAAAPAVGEAWRCYTVLNVREDAMELFGFGTAQERTLFRRLLSVTGVGAKTALGILSAMSVRDLSVAILTGDTAALLRAPGIGKKTAQRILLELKDKVQQSEVSAEGVQGAQGVGAPAGSAAQEAQAALQALGYTAAEAARAVSAVQESAQTTDQIIMLALRHMSSL